MPERSPSPLFGVDQAGLGKVDRAILTALCRHFGGGPVGLSTLAVSAGEETETVEAVYGPFLLGFLRRTPRALQHLGLTAPTKALELVGE